jgi:hypothetical protein
MYFNKMVYWEICCRATETGFQCELPEGTYFIGDPNEMLLPGIGATIKHLNTGTFSDAESDAVIVLHPFNIERFNLVSPRGVVNVFSESGVIALMSADIVKPLPEFDDNKITFPGRVVVEVIIEDNSLLMTRKEELIALVPAEDEEPEESDEQMYVRLYAAQGIEY